MTAISTIWAVLSSRVGLAAIVAIGVWHIATNQAEERCDVATVRAELAIAQADLVAAYKAENKANKQAESLSITTNRYRETVDELEAKLSQRSDRAACRMSDADVRSLLDIDAGEH